MQVSRTSDRVGVEEPTFNNHINCANNTSMLPQKSDLNLDQNIDLRCDQSIADPDSLCGQPTAGTNL